MSVGQLMSDVVSALGKSAVTVPQRRAIAALMLIHECSFDVAAAALSKAAAYHEEESGGPVRWSDPRSLRMCINDAGAWAKASQPRLRLLQGGAP